MENPQTTFGESESSISLLSRNPSIKSSPTARLSTLAPQNGSVIRNWPDKPKKLKGTATALPLRILSQATVALIPTCFIILGVFISSVNRNNVSQFGNSLIQATQVASTLWPIAFAAVIGPMLKVVALYRAERGAKLGTIEMFSQSQTLVSTVKGCYSLRILSYWPLFLIGLWSFSPAGGQAVLRLLRLEHSKMSNQTLFYFPNTAFSQVTSQSPIFSASMGSSYRSHWQMLYGTVLSAPSSAVLLANGSSTGFEDAVKRISRPVAINGTRQDTWGNVRVPFLDLLPQYNKSSPYQWVDIPRDEVVPYVSLVGVSVRGIDPSEVGEMVFTLSTTYFSLECSLRSNLTSWFETHSSVLLDHSLRNSSIFRNSNFLNFPNIFLDLVANHSDQQPKFINSSQMSLAFDSQGPKYTLAFGARSYDPDQETITFCPITLNYVDVYVDCTRLIQQGQLSCSARRIRRKPDSFDDPNKRKVFQTWIRYAFPEIVNFQASELYSYSGVLESYLKDPTRTFNFLNHASNYSDVPMPVFSARLAMLINTFWYSVLNTSIFLNVDSASPSPTDYNFGSWGNMTGNWTTPTLQVYIVSKPWMALYIIATIILSACALVTIVLQSRTRAPDILGSVSTLTRDSPYVLTVPPGGSGLDSTERARLLKDVWVRIQDVQPENEIGKIAFSDSSELGSRLKWSRSYE